MGANNSQEYKYTISIPEYVETDIKKFSLISDKNSAIHWLNEFHKIYEDITSKFIATLLRDNTAYFKTSKYYHNKDHKFVLFIFEYIADGNTEKKALWLVY